MKLERTWEKAGGEGEEGNSILRSVCQRQSSGLSPSHTLPHIILTVTCGTGIIIPIIYKIELRLREIKYLSQDGNGKAWWSPSP